MALELSSNRTRNHLIVVDNFYNDPQAVRDYALSHEFREGRPYYPGIRSDRRMTGEMQGALRDLIGVDLDFEHRYNGVFQVTCDHDDADAYVHHDSTAWAGVV